MSYWDVLTADDGKELLKAGHRLPQDLPGHAQEFETAMALALFEENVRTDAVADQPDPKPSAALADTGQAFFDRIVDRVAAHVEAMLEGRSVAPIPEFHP